LSLAHSAFSVPELGSVLLLALATLHFYFLHSLLAWPGVKRWAATILGLDRRYRLVYSLVAVVTLGAVVWAWQRAAATAPDPGLGLTMLGWALMGLGSALALAAVLRFGGSGFLGLTEQRTVGLVRSGLHGRVRHPIYLGVLVALAGWLIVSWIPATWVVVGITLVYLPIGIRLEEHKLIAEFGEDYRRYRREVPALFPRLVPQR